MAQDYSNWTKEDLIEEMKRLRKRKKYGLVWEDKPEDVVEQCKKELPVLEEVKDKEISTDSDKPVNLLIEGDNFHALSVLNYTHKNKIDLIYIDPPYNTGARDWKYNNDYVDINDVFRHSKWISMMSNRLKIAKNLLKRDGVLICTIDKNENATLLLLLEELFPAYDVTTVVIEHNPKGLPSSNFSYSHEYAHFVIPKGLSVIGKNPATKEDTRNLRRAGRASYRTERPTMFYPIYIKDGKVKRIGPIPEASFHPGKRSILKDNGEIEIWPIDDRGKERRWHFGLDSIEDHIERIGVKEKNGDYQLYVTAVPARYKTVWTGGDLDAGKYGTSLVKEIIGKEFPFPKSLYATAKCLETVVYKKENATILDFFAGSGTTGHAVMMMNQQYGGSRNFILCTNNELNGQEKELREKGLTEQEIQEYGICRAVTYPRIRKVIEGYNNTKGIKANLKYFITSFVPADPTDKNKIELTKKATEMLCIKEDTFEEAEFKEKFKIFRNKNHYTGIIFDHQAIDDFKRAIKDIDGRFSVYVFSLGDDTFDDEFADIKNKVKLSPIPEAILRVYRRIFK
ncbi:site-specific DNA-methyltransferase [Candidatus Microgenomates bacterium]|jgi:adenine-specific DNA-methyltransferase|nr:MAG: site-specific DNA-methyltransferase [Candidatus Microgenomates bacterium]